jgi:hypothetical protein
MESIINLLKRESSLFIEHLRVCPKGTFLVRGFKEQIDTYRFFNHDLENRKPLHTPLETHDFINQTFLDVFGWKIRNGVFCYGFNALNLMILR